MFLKLKILGLLIVVARSVNAYKFEWCCVKLFSDICILGCA